MIAGRFMISTVDFSLYIFYLCFNFSDEKKVDSRDHETSTDHSFINNLDLRIYKKKLNKLPTLLYLFLQLEKLKIPYTHCNYTELQQ